VCHVSMGVGKDVVCRTRPHALVKLLADSASVQTVISHALCMSL